MPLSLRQGVSLVEADGLRRLYKQVALVLDCEPPNGDFDSIASEMSTVANDINVNDASRDDLSALVASRAARARLLSALEHPRFRWRSLDALAAAAAVSSDVAADLLRAEASVRFSRGKSGAPIAGLKSRVGESR
jgi:hypothetical protein